MTRTVTLALMLAALVPCARPADATSESADASGKKTTFDLSFKGGTPSQLVAAMEKAAGAVAMHPDPINAVVPPELEDIRIPPMELRGVTATSVFETLTYMDPSLRWIPARGASAIWVLTRRDDRKTQAYYIGHLLKKFKVDDITTAVKTTWEMTGKNAKVELKYHADTQLLIARAQSADIQAMSDVISQLQLAVEFVPAEAAHPRPLGK